MCRGQQYRGIVSSAGGTQESEISLQQSLPYSLDGVRFVWKRKAHDTELNIKHPFWEVALKRTAFYPNLRQHRLHVAITPRYAVDLDRVAPHGEKVVLGIPACLMLVASCLWL